MNTESSQRPEYEVIEEVSKWSVGLGTLIFALFPLALPILALTAIVLLPLLIPLLAAGLLALPIVLIRRAWRQRSRRTTVQIDPTRTPRSAS